MSLRLRRLNDIIVDIMPGQRQILRLANWSGVAYYWLMSSVIITTVLYIVIPALWGTDGDTSTGKQTAIWIFVFFSLNMMANYLICLFCNTFYDAGKLTVPTAEGGKNWGYCVPCQQYIPPRAHHCPVCLQCVLKRDQHCFFLGKCIGHRNQRYFLVFVFYAALTALFALLCFGSYLNQEIGTVFSWPSPIPNFKWLYPYATIQWLTGSLPTVSFFVLTLFYTSVMLTVGCGMLFFHHFGHVLRGQTTFEAATGNTAYDVGAQGNLREVFGRYWWLCFILPLKQAQSVDGVQWSRVKDVKAY